MRGDKRLICLVVEEGEWGNCWVSRVLSGGTFSEPVDVSLDEDMKSALGLGPQPTEELQ